MLDTLAQIGFGLFGLAMLLSIALLCSNNRRAIDRRLVATGVLHDAGGLRPEKHWGALDADALARAFAVNATGPALVAKHFLPLVPRTGRSVFAALSARVGSIQDNRAGGWYAYRASKAALNMLLRNFAIELKRRGDVRRAKLYYLRQRSGKSARIKEKLGA